MAKQIPLPKKYKIPENWKWVELGTLTFMRSGFPFDSRKFSSEQKGRKPLIRIRDVVRGETTTYTDEECPDEYIIHYGDVLIGMDGDFNTAKWKSEDALLNQRVCYIRTASNALLNDYLYYYLPDPLKKINDATPSVTVKHLSTKTLSKTSIPLPPLPEQQRIVDRIESLFAKLDEAKEKAQAVVDGFEDRKAAILHKAFTGELTTEWRSERNLALSTWKNALMQDVCEKITCGKTPKEFIHSKGEVPFLKVYNIVNNEVDFENAPQFIPAEIHNGKLSSSILKPNDVIMNIVGPPLRKIAIIPETYKEWNMNQAIVRFRPKECLYYRYLYYALINPETLDEVIIATRGVVGQANISVSQSRNLKITIPTMEEQEEIVKILDTILISETRTKEVAEQAIDQINTMKKSILSRAFRGELGTNDHADESAEELLKRILE